MACTVTIFGRPLANMSEADAFCFRGHLAELDDCDDCVSYKEAQELSAIWLKQKMRLTVFCPIGPEPTF